MNPNATEFVPSSHFAKLWDYPFFQQRLKRFLYTHHRITKVRVEELQLLIPFPPIQSQKKAKVIFMGIYNNIPLLYEANQWDNPRTGAFVSIS